MKYTLHIEDEKDSVLIMVPSEEKESIVESTPKAKYLLVSSFKIKINKDSKLTKKSVN